MLRGPDSSFLARAAATPGEVALFTTQLTRQGYRDLAEQRIKQLQQEIEGLALEITNWKQQLANSPGVLAASLWLVTF